MAHASRKSFGPGQQDQDKGDGSGGMAPADPPTPLRSEVLSNRDTSRHSHQRGLDSAHVHTSQGHPHASNHARSGDVHTDQNDADKLADERPAHRTQAPGA